MSFEHLFDVSARYTSEIEGNFPALPRLSVYQRDDISGFEAVVYEPLICLILQGAKTTTIGDAHAELSAGDALLVSHDLPVVSQITEASAQRPYRALILSLDLADVRALHAQIAQEPEQAPITDPLPYMPVDASWLEPLIRYVELAGKPLDARVLGPSILREIHYRLLLSPIGQRLRSLLVQDSHASRIGDAIKKLRAEFRTAVPVSDLAVCAGMSVSSFHKHFKSVTGVTPLAYQKELRLIEARALLVGSGATVADAAFAVGYESPTHFSRDYRRKFGLPPSQDTAS